MRLANKKPSKGTGVIVDPVNPQASVIYKRITSKNPADRMPSGADEPLPAGEIACILEWLKTAEAPSDGGTTDGAATDAAPSDTAAATDSAKSDAASGG